MTAGQRRARQGAVWLVSVTLEGLAAVPASWRAVLTEAETARVDRFRRMPDQLSNAAARCLLRLLLGRATGQSPRLVRLAVGEHGKPLVADRPDLHINATHTDGLAAAALCHRLPLGIDAEYLHRHVVDRDLVTAALGPAAVPRLLRLPEPQRRRAFFSLWTAREAMSKADGRGLALPQSALRLVPEAPSGLVAAAGGRRWWIVRPDVGRDHMAAVALAVPGAVAHRRLTAADLTAWAEGAAA